MIKVRKKQVKKHFKLKVENHAWSVVGDTTIAKSNQFSRNLSCKQNVIAVKRFFEKLTYTEIDMKFR